MAATSLRSGQRTRRSLLPWLLAAAILLLIAWRIHHLVNVQEVRTYASFVGAFFSSLQLGSLYALIALGYTMVYGIIRLINFAHGEVFMVGAFAAYFLFTLTPLALPVAIIVAAVVTYGFMQILNFWRGSMTDPLILAGRALAFITVTIALASTTLGWLAAMVL